MNASTFWGFFFPTWQPRQPQAPLNFVRVSLSTLPIPVGSRTAVCLFELRLSCGQTVLKISSSPENVLSMVYFP